MNEELAKSIYDSNGGNAMFGDYQAYLNALNSNPKYVTHIYNKYGSKNFGSQSEFEGSLKKKEPTQPESGSGSNQTQPSSGSQPSQGKSVMEQAAEIVSGPKKTTLSQVEEVEAGTAAPAEFGLEGIRKIKGPSIEAVSESTAPKMPGYIKIAQQEAEKTQKPKDNIFEYKATPQEQAQIKTDKANRVAFAEEQRKAADYNYNNLNKELYDIYEGNDITGIESQLNKIETDYKNGAFAGKEDEYQALKTDLFNRRANSYSQLESKYLDILREDEPSKYKEYVERRAGILKDLNEAGYASWDDYQLKRDLNDQKTGAKRDLYSNIDDSFDVVDKADQNFLRTLRMEAINQVSAPNVNGEGNYIPGLGTGFKSAGTIEKFHKDTQPIMSDYEALMNENAAFERDYQSGKYTPEDANAKYQELKLKEQELSTRLNQAKKESGVTDYDLQRYDLSMRKQGALGSTYETGFKDLKATEDAIRTEQENRQRWVAENPVLGTLTYFAPTVWKEFSNMAVLEAGKALKPLGETVGLGDGYGWTDAMYYGIKDVQENREALYGYGGQDINGDGIPDDLPGFAKYGQVLAQGLGSVGAFMIPGTYASNLFKGSSLGMRSARFATNWAGGFLMMEGPAYDEALRAGLSNEDAARSATLIATLQSAAEQLVPDIKYLDAPVTRAGIISMAKAKVPWDEIMSNGMKYLQDLSTATGKSSLKEAGEEVVGQFATDVGQTISNDAFVRTTHFNMNDPMHPEYSTKPYDNTWELKNYTDAAIGGALTGGFMTGLKGATRTYTKNEMEALSYMGKNWKDILANIEKTESNGVNRGDERFKEIEKDLKGVSTLYQSLQSMPGYKDLTKANQDMVLSLAFQKKNIQENVRNLGVELPSVKEALAGIDESINAYMTGQLDYGADKPVSYIDDNLAAMGVALVSVNPDGTYNISPKNIEGVDPAESVKKAESYIQKNLKDPAFSEAFLHPKTNKDFVQELTEEEKDRKQVLEESIQDALSFAANRGEDPVTVQIGSRVMLFEDAQKELETLNQKANAVQEQKTSEVPVQPEAGVGEEVAQGKPTAEPQVTTEEVNQEEVAPEVRLTEPTIEERLADIQKGNLVTFKYENDEQVPEEMRQYISSRGKTNGVKEVRVTIPKVLADYLIQEKTAGKTETPATTTDNVTATEQDKKLDEFYNSKGNKEYDPREEVFLSSKLQAKKELEAEAEEEAKRKKTLFNRNPKVTPPTAGQIARRAEIISQKIVENSKAPSNTDEVLYSVHDLLDGFGRKYGNAGNDHGVRDDRSTWRDGKFFYQIKYNSKGQKYISVISPNIDNGGQEGNVRPGVATVMSFTLPDNVSPEKVGEAAIAKAKEIYESGRKNNKVTSKMLIDGVLPVVKNEFTNAPAKVEVKKVESPKVEATPTPEAPKVEASTLETPVVETPTTEAKPAAGVRAVKPKVFDAARKNTLLAKFKNDSGKRALVSSIDRAATAIRQAYGNVPIYVHETTADMQAATAITGGATMSRTGAGTFQYDADGNVIAVHVNLAKAGIDTAPHEFTHLILMDAFGDNPKLFKEFKDRIVKALSASRVAELEAFANQYTDENVKAEEFLAQLAGVMTANFEKLTPTMAQKIMNLINEFISRLTKGKLIPFKSNAQTKDLMDFFNTVSSAMATGKGGEAIKAAAEKAGSKFETAKKPTQEAGARDRSREQNKETGSNTDSFFNAADETFPNDHILGGYAVTDSNNKLIGRVVLSYVDDNTVKVDEVVSEQRGQRTGNGSAIMNKVIDLADKNNVTLTLTPNLILSLKAKGFETPAKLQAFYEKFGFVKDSKKATMTRVPNPTAKSKEQIKPSDAKAIKPENFAYDNEWDVVANGEKIGRTYYDRSIKSWVNADFYKGSVSPSKNTFLWVYGDILGETKQEAINELVRRYNEGATEKDIIEQQTPVIKEATKEDVNGIYDDIKESGMPVYQSPLEQGTYIVNDNVFVKMYPFDGSVHLSSISSMEKGKGNASSVMRQITNSADNRGLKMDLGAKAFSEGGLKTSQLIDFYTKFGFTIDPEGMFAGDSLEEVKQYIDENPRDSVDMIRLPKVKSKEQIVGQAGVETAADDIAMQDLDVAKQMEAANRPAQDIKSATGWEVGADGQWRYEYSDVELNDDIADDFDVLFYLQENAKREGVRVRPNEMYPPAPLNRILDFGKLEKAYPYIDEITFAVNPNLGGATAVFRPDRNLIEFGPDAIKKEGIEGFRRTLIHEIQHYVQEQEGFEGGSNLTYEADKFSKSQDVYKIPGLQLNGAANVGEAVKNGTKEILDMMDNGITVTEIMEGNYDKNKYSGNPEAILKHTANEGDAEGLDEMAATDLEGAKKIVENAINRNAIADVAYNEYRTTAGEVEARNAEERSRIPYAERLYGKTLESTEDVARRNQVLESAKKAVSAMDVIAKKRGVAKAAEIKAQREILGENYDKAKQISDNFEDIAEKLGITKICGL